MIAILGAIFVYSYVQDKNKLEGLTFEGARSRCLNEECGPVENYYILGNPPAKASNDVNYSGQLIPKACKFILYDYDDSRKVCEEEINISNLPNYKLSTSSDSLAVITNYSYLGLKTYNGFKDKTYLLYSYDDGKNKKEGRFVYENPLRVISYDSKTKEVKSEGDPGLHDLVASLMYISPKGVNLLIIDSNDPRVWPIENYSGITAYNLDTKKSIEIDRVFHGRGIDFVDWIDDYRFIYKIVNYFKDKEKVLFKIGTIK